MINPNETLHNYTSTTFTCLADPCGVTQRHNAAANLRYWRITITLGLGWEINSSEEILCEEGEELHLRCLQHIARS